MLLDLLVSIFETIWQVDTSFIVVAKACGMMFFFLNLSKTYTPLNTHMEPENFPLRKKRNIDPNH